MTRIVVPFTIVGSPKAQAQLREGGLHGISSYLRVIEQTLADRPWLLLTIPISAI